MLLDQKGDVEKLHFSTSPFHELRHSPHELQLRCMNWLRRELPKA